MERSDYQILSEIYRAHFWQIEWGALNYYREAIRGKVNPESFVATDFEERQQHPTFLVFQKGETSPKEELIITSHTPWYERYGELTSEDQIINVLPLTGAITSGGTWCSYGTRELADKFRFADNSEHVVGHLVLIDTPGGAANANDLNEVLQNSNKPVVGLIRGQNASKGVEISAFIPHVFAERGDIEIGSVGVYSSFYGEKHGFEKDGVKYVEVYDPKSEKKNYEFREAIQNDNYEPLEKRLTAIGERFRGNVKNRWPDVADERLTGEMYPANQVIGQMVDGIKSYESTIDYIFELAGVDRKEKGKITPIGIIPEKEEADDTIYSPTYGNITSQETNEPPELSTEQTASSAATEVMAEGQHHNPQNTLSLMKIEQLKAILGDDVQATVREDGTVEMTPELNEKVANAYTALGQKLIKTEQSAEQLQQTIDAQKETIEAQARETKPLRTGAAAHDNALEGARVIEGSILAGVTNMNERMKKVKSFAEEFGLPIKQ